MAVQFKMDPRETVIAQWHEAYVSFDGGAYWYAIGGGESPKAAQAIIEWYKGRI